MSLLYFLQSSTVNTSADTPKVNFTLTPSTGSSTLGRNQLINVILKTGSSSQKISGFDIVIKSSGIVSLWNISTPKNINGSSLNIMQIAKTISPKETRVSYVINQPDSTLPQGVTMTLQYYGASAGQGTIYLDSARSQVVGNITDHIYTWGKLVTGTYSFK